MGIIKNSFNILNTINDIISFYMIEEIEKACVIQLFDSIQDPRLDNIIRMLYFEAYDLVSEMYENEVILTYVTLLVDDYCLNHHKYTWDQ